MQRSNGTGWAPAQGWIVTPLKLEKEGWDWFRSGGGGRSFTSSEEYWASACHGSCPAIQLQTPMKEEKGAQFLTNLAESWVVDYDSTDFPKFEVLKQGPLKSCAHLIIPIIKRIHVVWISKIFV